MIHWGYNKRMLLLNGKTGIIDQAYKLIDEFINSRGMPPTAIFMGDDVYKQMVDELIAHEPSATFNRYASSTSIGNIPVYVQECHAGVIRVSHIDFTDAFSHLAKKVKDIE